MAIVVVGGSGRSVGKTTLVCSIIAAFPQFRWRAVKISSENHGKPEAIWQEHEAGQGTGTARYLAAGAQAAYLLSPPAPAASFDLPVTLKDFWAAFDPGTNFIFESNEILHYVKPDVCLLVDAGNHRPEKPSFRRVLQFGDALVFRSGADGMLDDAAAPPSREARPIFHLGSFERLSPEILLWLKARLPTRA